VTEGADVHPDGGNPDGLDGPLDVPDRHVTDRSNGDEEYGVDLLGAQDLRPLGGDPVPESELRGGTDERPGHVVHLTDDALVAYRKLTSVARVADVLFWDSQDSSAVFWSVRTGCGSRGSERIEFPDIETMRRWQES
jgi:hypothetical protein